MVQRSSKAGDASRRSIASSRLVSELDSRKARICCGMGARPVRSSENVPQKVLIAGKPRGRDPVLGKLPENLFVYEITRRQLGCDRLVHCTGWSLKLERTLERRFSREALPFKQVLGIRTAPKLKMSLR